MLFSGVLVGGNLAEASFWAVVVTAIALVAFCSGQFLPVLSALWTCYDALLGRALEGGSSAAAPLWVVATAVVAVAALHPEGLSSAWPAFWTRYSMLSDGALEVAAIAAIALVVLCFGGPHSPTLAACVVSAAALAAAAAYRLKGAENVEAMGADDAEELLPILETGKMRGPTMDNPFMNPNLSDYEESFPTAAKDSASVRDAVHTHSKDLWVNTGELGGRGLQRQFYTVPPCVPADTIAFANWLYKSTGKTESVLTPPA